MGKLFSTRFLLVACSFLMLCNAQASGISIEVEEENIFPGDQITVNILYDFTDFAMFGGGMDLYYDASTLELVSYTRADHSADQAQDAASPVGDFIGLGLYGGFGVGTFDFVNGGMSDSGVVGTFVFTFTGLFDSNTPCGLTLCLGPDLPTNPFVSFAGQDVTDTFFPNDFIGYILPLPVPVPAAIWFFLGGLGFLLGWSKK